MPVNFYVDEIVKAIRPILLFFSSLVDNVPTEDKALKILRDSAPQAE